MLIECIEEGLKHKTDFKYKAFADTYFPLPSDDEFTVLTAAEDTTNAKLKKSE